MKYAFIAQHQGEYEVKIMCRVLAVSISSYYQWRKRPLSARAQENEQLAVTIQQIYNDNRRLYGSRRMRVALHKQGWHCNRKRVARLMRLQHLRGCERRKRRIVTTKADADRPVVANLLQQDFSASAPNKTWLRIVYASTSGVYGDAGGARIDETRSVAPQTDRARRRVDAEVRMRHHGRAFARRVSVLRIPGIYALDRKGGDPRERVRRGTPLLQPADDVYTNHIHADDLARACVAALTRGAPQRIYHVSDDSESKMGEHFDAVADAFALPRAPRLSRSEAERALSPMQMSFLSESRRLDNRRLRQELRLRLRYPTPAAAWAAASASAGPPQAGDAPLGG